MKSIQNTKEYKAGFKLAAEYAEKHTVSTIKRWLASLKISNQENFDIGREGRIDYYKEWLLKQLLLENINNND